MNKKEFKRHLAEKYECSEKLAENIVSYAETLEGESQIIFEDEHSAVFRDFCSFRLLKSNGGSHTVRLCICSLAVKDTACGGDEYSSLERIDYSIL